MSITAPRGNDGFTTYQAGDDDSLEKILEAQERAETKFAKSLALPDVREPLEQDFFTEDDSLEFS